MKKLPERFAVLMEEDNRDLVQWFENKIGRKISPYNCYWHFPEFDGCVCTSYYIEKDYKVITPEQLREFINREKPKAHTLRKYREWRVGDGCYFGKAECEVIAITIGDTHPIKVIFQSNKNMHPIGFTLNGSYHKAANDQSLSFLQDELSMPFDEVQIEVDTLVYVRDNEDEEWIMRFFSHFDEGGKLYCFNDQYKSNQTTSATTWEYYSLTNPLED